MSETSGPAAVSDPWALLGLPRSAALDENAIRQAFQKAAAESHPDGAADDSDKERRTAHFTRLNEASAILQSAAARLRALRALEFPGAGNTPPALDAGLMDLFSRVGTALQNAREAAVKKRQAGSALARALLAAGEMQTQEGLQETGAALQEQSARLTTDLAEVDRRLAAQDGSAEEFLTLTMQRAAFLEKWQAQLRAAFQSMLG